MSGKESVELYTELHRLGRQMHRISHREWHEHGHYREVSRLLGLIAQNEGVMQRDLAEQMDVRPSSMTEMLSRMEAHGLISREPDEKDQRVVRVRLTPAGSKMVEESAEATADLVGEMFKGMTDEEIATMLNLTRKLGANLDAMTPPYGAHGNPFERRHGFGGERGFHHHGFSGHGWFD